MKRFVDQDLDHFFYDVDKQGQFVRVQSDVLLRVLASEVGDRDFFDGMLKRYLLNTSKFFAKYPFTSLSMEDPRFDPFSSYNTWAGATNFLSLIRAPHAFEYHQRYVELTWILQPIISALSRMTRFGQCLSPWTGEEGYTESYSPSNYACLIILNGSAVFSRPPGVSYGLPDCCLIRWIMDFHWQSVPTTAVRLMEQLMS